MQSVINFRTKEEQEFLDTHICPLPFHRVEVGADGNVRFCCHYWNPTIIGNVADQNFEDIWYGAVAESIRDSMRSPDHKPYLGCIAANCEKIKSRKLRGLDYANDLSVLETQPPVELEFNIDRTCNLKCPSCRVSATHDIDDHRYQFALDIFRKTVKPFFQESHDRLMTINIDGSGEVFASRVYRKLFETEPLFTDPERWPNLQFVMQTNGTLLTEKLQNTYAKFVDRIVSIWISIDAGNEQSYNLTRVGGDWNLLWKNIDAYYDRIKGTSRQWTWNLIIQRDNFRSIPEFIERALQYSNNLPDLALTDIVNWGTRSPHEFADIAVHLPEHPLHNEYLAIMNMDIVKNYPKKHYK
jgi:sulfatase maturation enzyme AslB (radical SAM superfamily)